MSKRPPLYDYTSLSWPIFVKSLKILGVSHRYPRLRGFHVSEFVLRGSRAHHNVHSSGVRKGMFSLSFNQLCQEMVEKSNSPLHLACEMGDQGKVKALCVFSHIDVSNMDGDTPLHVACRHGHGDICEYLVSEMVYKYHRNMLLRVPDNEHVKDFLCNWRSLKRSQLVFLTLMKEVEHQVIIVCRVTPSLFSLNNSNELPVHLALKCSNQSCLESLKNVPDTCLILSCHNIIAQNVHMMSLQFRHTSHQHEADRNILHCHKDSKYMEIFDVELNVRMWLDEFHHLQTSQFSQYDKYFDEYRIFLHYHKDSKYKEMVDAGLKVHSLDHDGLLVVEKIYFYYKDVPCVVENISRHSIFPLHYLIEHYYSTLLLVSRNVDSSNLIDKAWSKYYSQTDIKGNLPLHLLCERLNIMDDDKLLGRFSRCEINIKNSNGHTPFEVAFREQNYLTCIWLMLRKQCDVFLYGTKMETQRCKAIKTLTEMIFEDTRITFFSPLNVIAGDTLLHLALKCGTEELVVFKFLKTNIWEIRLNSRQESPLHVACRHGHSSSILQLLIHCNMEQQDIDGNTPFGLLCKHHPHRYDLMLCLMNFPSFPSSNSIEIVMAKWFQNIEKSRLSELCISSNNALHIALEMGDLETIRLLKDRYTGIFFNLVSLRNDLDELPFHVAGRLRNKEGLALVFEGGNPDVVTKFGNTALHLACEHFTDTKRDLEVIKFLVEELKCNPQLCNIYGQTPVYLACQQGCLVLVKYLLNEVKVDPNIKDLYDYTPLMVTSLYDHDIIRELIESGAETGHLYETYKEFFVKYSSQNPPPTPLNIIVVGKPSSGKTTIIKALKSEGNYEMVSPEEHTVGIIPSSFVSKSFGCTAWYDLAGQSEYYASHEAVLHTLMSSSSPLILLLVDCQKSQELIHLDILYWLQFLKSQMPLERTDLRPHISIVFSFADKLPADAIEDKLIWCMKILTPFLQNSKFKFLKTIALDCRLPGSNEIDALRHQIMDSAPGPPDSLPVNFLLHCFYAFLLHHFHDKPAVTIKDVLGLRNDWVSLGIDPANDNDNESDTVSLHSNETFDYENEPTLDEESPAKLLPDGCINAMKLCKRLHQKGHVILIPDHTNFERSWLIINKDILLQEIHGTIFAPPHFWQYYKDLSTSTGVVASSDIESMFDYDVTMLIGFLTHLEHCHEIKDKNILKLLSSDSNYTSDDKYFYFPGLVKIEKPEGVWEISDQQSNQCCWLLQVANAHTFFTPRFVQILLLRIAFSYPFAVTNRRIGFPSLTLCRACCVWKNGIFWRTDIGIECLLEITEECQAVVLMFRSTDSELSSEDLASFSYLRSSLISKILSTSQELCPALNVSEYLCHPEYMQYPIKLCQQMALYSIKSVARAICQKSKVVLCDNPLFRNIPLIKLVQFEPLTSFCIGRLFNDSFQDQIVSADDLEFISKVASSGQFCASYYYIFRTKECSLHISEIQLENIGELLKSQKKLSYKTLRSFIGNFSIFGNRDPQVNIQYCLICFLSL